MQYHHELRAGNASDVWKHLILSQVAAYRLASGVPQIYVESHAGFPEYQLQLVRDVQWIGGIGRLWPIIDDLETLDYFRVIKEMNGKDLQIYPGSVSLVIRISKWFKTPLSIAIWDTNPDVILNWSCNDFNTDVSYHLGNGFFGVEKLLTNVKDATLLIDSPIMSLDDVNRSQTLLTQASQAGWTVLCWFIDDGRFTPTVSKSNHIYSLRFSDAGLDQGRFTGCGMILGSKDEGLVSSVDRAVETFLNVCKFKMKK